MDLEMLPIPDPSDSSETRWALETARTLWGQGETREALQWVRRAAEAAAESGQDDRALLLAKQGAELRNALDIPRTLPPQAPVAPRPTSPSAAVLPATPPRGFAPPPKPSVSPVSPTVSDVIVPTLHHAAEPTAKSVAPSPQSVAPSSSPTITVAPGSVRLSTVPPSERPEELVVTVVSNDGSLPAPDASLVSRRAVRVAVIAVENTNELRVRKLAPGEVAPRESTVALLVAFEPGEGPVPGSN